MITFSLVGKKIKKKYDAKLDVHVWHNQNMFISDNERKISNVNSNFAVAYEKNQFFADILK